MASGKESACQRRRHRFDPWSRKIPCAPEQLSPWAIIIELVLRAWEPQLLSPSTASREKLEQRSGLSTAKNKQVKWIFKNNNNSSSSVIYHTLRITSLCYFIWFSHPTQWFVATSPPLFRTGHWAPERSSDLGSASFSPTHALPPRQINELMPASPAQPSVKLCHQFHNVQLSTPELFSFVIHFILSSLCNILLLKLQQLKWAFGASLMAQMVKNLPAKQEIWVWSLGQEDPLEKGIAIPHPLQYSCLENPKDKELGWLQSRGCKELDMTWQLTFSLSTLKGLGFCEYSLYKILFYKLPRNSITLTRNQLGKLCNWLWLHSWVNKMVPVNSSTVFTWNTQYFLTKK